MSQPVIEPYTPFPAFKEFASESGFDERAFELFAEQLHQAKELADPARLRSSVEKATRWAAVDTGAIEGLYDVDRGFTLTVAADAAAWDNIHMAKGEFAERAIKDALAGYEYVLDLVTDSQPITETWIKQLHEVLCASQDTYTVITAVGPQDHELPRGQYKDQPNNPINLGSNAVHSYAPVDDTPAEMHRLVQELRSDAFAAAHPVVQAAYAHYAFVCVHPFADGNGRVSRALASVYLYRSPGVPLVIFADQKPQYIDALEMADRGTPAVFVQFIADRAIDSVRMVLTDLARAVPSEERAERMARMKQALVGKGGLAHTEVDALATLLVSSLNAALQKHLVERPPEPPITVHAQLFSGNAFNAPEGYRMPPNGQYVRVTAAAPAPGAASSLRDYGVIIAKPGTEGADFRVIAGGVGEPMCEVFLRDIHPHVSPALTYQLESVSEEQVWLLVSTVATDSETALRKAGYL